MRIFIFLGIGVLVLRFFYNPFEPHYQGKSLSAWAAILSENNSGTVLSENDQRQRLVAAKAIGNIGPKALPYAVELCRVQDSPLTLHLLEIADDDGKLLGYQLMTARVAHSRSWQMFHVLGPAAKPAIPALVQLLQETNRDIASIAGSDLNCIGPDVIPPMIELLTNQNAQMRMGALTTLLGMGREFKAQMHPALPILIQRLNDEDFQVRGRAANVLVVFDEDASEIVPALVAAIKQETNTYALFSIARVLGTFGTNAQAAVPILVENMQTDQSGHARFELNALRRISPDVAAVYYRKLNMAQTNPPPDASISNLYNNYYGQGVPFGSPRRPAGPWRQPPY